MSIQNKIVGIVTLVTWCPIKPPNTTLDLIRYFCIKRILHWWRNWGNKIKLLWHRSTSNFPASFRKADSTLLEQCNILPSSQYRPSSMWWWMINIVYASTDEGTDSNQRKLFDTRTFIHDTALVIESFLLVRVTYVFFFFSRVIFLVIRHILLFYASTTSFPSNMISCFGLQKCYNTFKNRMKTKNKLIRVHVSA